MLFGYRYGYGFWLWFLAMAGCTNRATANARNTGATPPANTANPQETATTPARTPTPLPLMFSGYGYDRVSQSCHRKRTQHRHHTPGKHGDTTGNRHNTHPHPETAPAHAFRRWLSFPVVLSGYRYAFRSCFRTMAMTA